MSEVPRHSPITRSMFEKVVAEWSTLTEADHTPGRSSMQSLIDKHTGEFDPDDVTARAFLHEVIDHVPIQLLDDYRVGYSVSYDELSWRAVAKELSGLAICAMLEDEAMEIVLEDDRRSGTFAYEQNEHLMPNA